MASPIRRNVRTLWPWAGSTVWSAFGSWSTDHGSITAYWFRERQWVMDAMPTMPDEEWEEYRKWVADVREPLPLKLQEK